MVKIFCVLSNDTNLTGFPVDIDESLNVGDLKDAIYAKKISHLANFDAADLTLVRICKDVGGVTKGELKQCKEAMNIAYYQNAPEEPDVVETDAVDIGSFSAAPGDCKIVNGLIFKVMTSWKKISTYTETLPEELYHLLVVIPT
ncbi:hypothetical protein HDU99_004421, partial [Rhizoclosmatium hyalinum]